MKLERTFYPVGKGSFITERFIDDEYKAVFVVVYDCGSANKKDLGKSLNEFKAICSHIDMLCISHFDNDHTNGIGELIKNNMLDSRTVVLIPFKFPKALIVLNHPIAVIINQLMSLNVRIIGIDVDDVANSEEQIDFDSLRDGTILAQGIRILCKSKLSPMWIYVPLMHQENYNNVLTQFNKIIQAKESNPSILVDSQYLDSNWKNLKRIYNNLDPVSHQGNTSKINMNSLMLLSYTNTIKQVSIISCYYNWQYNPLAMCQCQPSQFNDWVKEYMPASCLYTGDTNLSNTSVFGNLMLRVRTYCKKTIGILQIPHHGSSNNYSANIVSSDKYLIAFVCCNPKNRAFHKEIVEDYMKANRFLCLVTHEDNTKFIQIIEL